MHDVVTGSSKVTGRNVLSSLVFKLQNHVKGGAFSHEMIGSGLICPWPFHSIPVSCLYGG